MEWAIDYWRGSLPLERVTSRESDWDDAPDDGVIFATFAWLERGKPYSIRCVGADLYSFDGETFGTWSEEADDILRGGTAYRLVDFEGMTAEALLKPPTENVKRGILIPDQEFYDARAQFNCDILG